MSETNRNQDTVTDLDARIGRLVGLGFSFQQAKDALKATNGDVDDAIDTLLSGQVYIRKRLVEVDASTSGQKTAYDVKGSPMDINHDKATSGTLKEEVEKEAASDENPPLTRPTADSSTVSVAAPNPRPTPPSLCASVIPSRRAQKPGAVAVRGPIPSPSRGNGYEYTITDQSHTTRRAYPPLSGPVAEATVTVEARLVEGTENDVDVLQDELRQRNEELQQQHLELERLHRERENVVVGQVLPWDEENTLTPTGLEEHPSSTPNLKRRRLLLGGCIALVVVVGIIIGIVIALTQPGSSVCDSLSCALSGQSYDIDDLDLSNSGLTGSIPNEIGLYTRLTSLYLYSNALTGTIPSEIGLLTTMDTLSLYDNALTGTIPSEIVLLTNLGRLFLPANKLSGTIRPEIGFMTNLINLELYNNDLTGTIPTQIARLINLHDLQLYSNELSGSIPSEIALLTKLELLYLYENTLRGTIPFEIGLLKNLDYLSLYGNDFSGDFTCPDFVGNCYISCFDSLPQNDLNSHCRTL